MNIVSPALLLYNHDFDMILKYLKRYPLSLLVFAAIVYLSLFRPSDDMQLPMLFEHMDKVVHFIMYAGLSFIIWYEFFRSHTKGMNIKLFLAIFLIPALFSGLMEYMQSKATDYRSGDIMDLLFNVLGIIFSNIICLTLFSYLLGKRKRRTNKE